MGYRLADRYDDLTPLQIKVLTRLPGFVNRKIDEALKGSQKGDEDEDPLARLTAGKKVRSLNDLVRVLPRDKRRKKK